MTWMRHFPMRSRSWIKNQIKISYAKVKNTVKTLIIDW